VTIDLEFYRRRVGLLSKPKIHLSVIDILPEHASQTVVFLHGYGGQANQWRYQLDEFSNSNRVIAIDLRGHGQSDKPSGDYSMPQIIKDIEQVLSGLEVDGNFILVGHSFGGALATEFAILHPENVNHLILIATAGEFELNPFYRFLLNLPKPILGFLGPIVHGWLSAPPMVMHAWYHQNVAIWNGWSLFRSLQVPTTVVRGHQDAVFSKAAFDEVARAIPDAGEIDVGASGHLVMLERRQAVNRVIHRSIETGTRSWRIDQVESESSRMAKLLPERPWLANYDIGVPHTIAVPTITLNQLLRSAASRFPRRPALVFEGAQITYRQLLKDVMRFTAGLQSRGVKPNDRVMLLLPNIPQMVIAYFGVLEAGAVAVFSHPITEEEEFIRQLNTTQARILITLDQFDEILDKLKTEKESGGLTQLSQIILTSPVEYLPFIKKLAFKYRKKDVSAPSLKGIKGINIELFSTFISSRDVEPVEIDISTEDLATIQFTGGTTDEPKGVMLSHRNLVANSLQTRHWMPPANEGKEKFLCVLPFSHSYGLTTALNLPVALGATMILKAKFETLDLLKSIQKYSPTIFPGVPRMYMAIKDFPGVRKFGISSIEACISGSAPLPVEVQEAFEKLTRGRLVEGYGLTEAGPVTHGNPLYGKRKIGTIGIPFPSTEARVLDLGQGKKEVRSGQIGELAVRGPQVMLGCWQDDVATRKKADMWYPHKPGEPAFPRDVEEVLFEIPQVRDAAVVAIANQPIAFVIAKGERPRASEMIAYCKRRLPPQLVPRLIIFVEDFPRTFIGKILRRELAKKFEQSQSNHQKILEDQKQASDPENG
jgi:long-chain acyl-CoA synthetase